MGQITLINGKTYQYKVDRGFWLENTRYKNITSLLKATKQIVFENCQHDVNTAFKYAKRLHCDKCGQWVENNNQIKL